MLVNAVEMLKKARDGRYAVAQININNLEWTKAVLQTVEELKSPVILGVSAGAAKYMTGFTTVVAMVKAMDAALNITVPVAIHLDHGKYDEALACIDAGFTSIMFDGSHFSIEENVEKTKELVEIAHKNGLSIEAEVGSIGGEEDGIIGMGEVADPEQCKLISSLGIDFLAAGIGNIHGVYPSNWKGLDFGALEKIAALEVRAPCLLRLDYLVGFVHKRGDDRQRDAHYHGKLVYRKAYQPQRVQQAFDCACHLHGRGGQGQHRRPRDKQYQPQRHFRRIVQPRQPYFEYPPRRYRRFAGRTAVKEYVQYAREGDEENYHA